MAEEEKGIRQMRPEEIQEKSFSIIRGELEQRGIRLKPEEEPIIIRAIHTTADFDYGENLVFSPGAVEAGLRALRQGAAVVTDTNMARAGINKSKLGSLGGEVFCFMADEDVAQIAKERGCTRAAVSMEKAAEWFGQKKAVGGRKPDSRTVPVFGEGPVRREGQGGHCPVIVAVGNAPTALVRLYELMEEEGFLPDLVIGVPVGFVNVVSSKERMMGQRQVPYIIAKGRKGGSNVAAAVVNALLSMT